MKKILIILCLVLTAACSSEPPTYNDEIRVFISWPKTHYKPFYWWDEKAKTFEGIDADVIKAILDDAKCKYIFVSPNVVSKQPRIDYLTKDLADVAIRCFSITESRKKLIGFSLPYYTDGLCAMVHKKSTIQNLEDLQGKKIIAYDNTTGFHFIKDKKITQQLVNGYDFDDEPGTLLNLRKVDAYVNDKSYLEVRQKAFKDVRVLNNTFNTEPWGIGIQKVNTQLKLVIDHSLTKLIKNGTIKKIFEKHGIAWTE